MDAATIQAKIYAGRAQVAARVGLPCQQYRPLAADAPLGNLLRTVPAAFNSGDGSYRSPNLPGDATWFADLDGRLTQPGDYLVRQSDGAVFFGVQLVSNEIPILGASDPASWWPIVLLMGGMGQSAGVNLPATVSPASWRGIVPASAPVVLQAGDVIACDLGRRYSITTAEQTDLGWRINASEVHA